MKKIELILYIIQAIYIFYMFNLFKTRYSIHLPFEKITQFHTFLIHPINTGKYESKICPLGNLVGILLPIWIIFKLYYKNKIINIANLIIWIIIVICSFIMNVNAFIYILPAAFLELYFIINYSELNS